MIDEEPASPTDEAVPARRHRSRIIVAAVAAGVVIAVGSSAVTAMALASASHLEPGGMAGMASPSSTQSAAPGPTVDTTGFPTGNGIFTDTCQHDLTAANDPILMPGMSGASMQHDFFGNMHVTASTVTKDLVGGATSCTTSADSSAYWTPVLFSNGTAMTPKSTLIYWRAPQNAHSSVQTIPAGLTMIAGKEDASAPQGRHVVAWTCSGSKAKSTDTPQDCPSGTMLRLVITFPNCWDGHNLNGAAQTNVVAMTGASCPTSHPVQIPQVVVHINYPTSSAQGLTLSIGPTQQGSTTTEHADFMNGWKEPVLTADVNACVVTGTRCGPVKGDEATPAGGVER